MKLRARAARLFAVFAVFAILATAMAFAGPGGDAIARFKLPVELNAQDPAPEPSRWSLSGFYSFNGREWSVVAANTFDTLWADLGGRKGVNVDLIAFAGAGAENLLVGGGIGISAPFHERIRLGLYLALAKRDASLADLFTNFDGFQIGAVGSITYEVKFNT